MKAWTYEVPKVHGESYVVVDALLATDFNNDARVDILLSYAEQYTDKAESTKFTTSTILYLMNNGKEGFIKGWDKSLELSRCVASAGDFNNDAFPDLIIGGYLLKDDSRSLKIAVFLNDKRGGMSKVHSFDLGSLKGLSSIVVEDFDNDGNTDFIAGGIAYNETSHHAILFLNDGMNFSHYPIELEHVACTWVMRTADFNKDGSLDLIVLDPKVKNQTMAIFLNDGYGRFTSFYFHTFGDFIRVMDISDFNNDGYIDIVYGESTGKSGRGAVSLMINDAGKTFEFRATGIEYQGADIVSIASIDFNHDGNADIFIARADSIGRVFINTELLFKEVWGNNFGASKFCPVYAVTVADINNDGYADLICIDTIGQAYLFLNEHLQPS